MCLDLCRSEYAKAVEGCKEGMSMVSSELDLCYGDDDRPSIPSEQLVELQDKQLNCFQSCKQGCLKLQYKYRINENKHSWVRNMTWNDVFAYHVFDCRICHTNVWNILLHRKYTEDLKALYSLLNFRIAEVIVAKVGV
ncbi:hypothetical protein AVEN_143845-1 [Araneus ventricosus]|uniref:Uncharacterized protein n=1 Tax=Araneus ventricosus TaxID=182803 RepID=A0A4Y2NZ64_ARAVE|nr:hypothetical protein AVEN_143845-1 [Araneus ventricosus]